MHNKTHRKSKTSPRINAYAVLAIGFTVIVPQIRHELGKPLRVRVGKELWTRQQAGGNCTQTVDPVETLTGYDAA